MFRTRFAAAIVTPFLLAACGSGSGSSDSPSTTESTTVTTYGGVPGAAQRIACDTDVRQLQQLSDFYKASHGEPATSLQTFVDDGSIDHLPTNDHGYVIAYDATTGKVTATGACTVN